MRADAVDAVISHQKCIITKENTRRRRFGLRKNNEADKTSDPIQSNSQQFKSKQSAICQNIAAGGGEGENILYSRRPERDGEVWSGPWTANQ